MGREEILKELKSTLDGAKARLDALEPDSKNIYIFGAGNTAQLYRKCFEVENLHPKAYLDNNKAGGNFYGVDIMAPKDVPDKTNALVLICSPQAGVNEFATRQLNELETKCLLIAGLMSATL